MQYTAKPRQTNTVKTPPQIGQRISISNIGATRPQPGQEQNVAAQIPRHQSNSFTADQLREAWNSYIVEHPKEVILTNAMRSSHPMKIGEGFNYEMMVDNLGQQGIINTHLDALHRYLHEKLSNDYVVIKIRVNEYIEKEVILSPQDIVADMMTRSDAVKNLINTFELGLG